LEPQSKDKTDRYQQKLAQITPSCNTFGFLKKIIHQIYHLKYTEKYSVCKNRKIGSLGFPYITILKVRVVAAVDDSVKISSTQRILANSYTHASPWRCTG